MRHGPQGRRQRNNNRGHNNNSNNGPRRNGNVPNRNQIFDSNGPDVRIRGTAHQVCEKYLALAKDASAIGDIVLAESYLQHAEHYQRIINSWNEEFRDFQRANPSYVPSDAQPSEEVAQEDDLALPISILGGNAKAASQADIQAEAPVETMLETA